MLLTERSPGTVDVYGEVARQMFGSNDGALTKKQLMLVLTAGDNGLSMKEATNFIKSLPTHPEQEIVTPRDFVELTHSNKPDAMTEFASGWSGPGPAGRALPPTVSGPAEPLNPFFFTSWPLIVDHMLDLLTKTAFSNARFF